MSAPYPRIACLVARDEAFDAVIQEGVRLFLFGAERLDVVHVAPEPLWLTMGPYGPMPSPESLYREAQDWLRVKATPIVGARPVILSGKPAPAALDYAERADIDLIVAAAHRGRVKRAMLGSFAAQIAYRAPCPVLIVHPPPPDDDAAGAEENPETALV